MLLIYVLCIVRGSRVLAQLSVEQRLGLQIAQELLDLAEDELQIFDNAVPSCRRLVGRYYVCVGL
jgi:hypothetical protein